MASKLPMMALLIAVTCLSQFYRVSNSVIAPELARDLHLSARQIGWAGSAFFFALFAVQLPVGLWFDRFGARRTVSAVSLLAVVGSIWIAHATDAADLIAGRIIVGVGCAASFMSVVFLCARWFSARELSTALCWVFAASNLGTLAGATPLAWVASQVGWRNGFLGLSAVTLVVAVLFYVVVRDRPPEFDPADHPQGAAAQGLQRPVAGLAHQGPAAAALHAFLRLRHDADGAGRMGRTVPVRRPPSRRRAARQRAAGDGRGADARHPDLRADGPRAALAQEGSDPRHLPHRRGAAGAVA